MLVRGTNIVDSITLLDRAIDKFCDEFDITLDKEVREDLKMEVFIGGLLVDHIINIAYYTRDMEKIYLDLKTGKQREVTPMELLVCEFKPYSFDSILKELMLHQ